MSAVDLVKTLIAEGVEFETDGKDVRCRNANGRITPDIVSMLAAEKPLVIDFLSGKSVEVADLEPAVLNATAVEHTAERDPRRRSNVILGPWERQPGDVTLYEAALRRRGPMSYGMAADVLGWGATRAGQAEQDLSKSGRVTFNGFGRAVLVDREELS